MQPMPPRPLALSEQRAHPRIAAPATVWVTTSSGRRFELPARDVSLGGVFLYVSLPFAPVGETVKLELGLPAGGLTAPLEATVVRTVAAPDDSSQLLGVGLQFRPLSAGQRTAVSAFLNRLLAGPGGQRRAYPRVAHRLRVTCTGKADVRAVVRDLSVGGASLWLEAPVAVGESLGLELSHGQGASLRLTATVIDTRWAREGEPYDQARVRFEHPDDSGKEALRAFLSTLARG
jgi:hypothetical protein